MIKNKIDYKLINTALITFIVFLFVNLNPLWQSILAIVKPFIIGLGIAYALNPIIEKIPLKRNYAVTITIVFFSLIIAFYLNCLIPIISNEVDNILKYLKILNMKYELIGIISYCVNYIEQNINIKTIFKVGDMLTSTALILGSSIYFLIDYHKIKKELIKIKIIETINPVIRSYSNAFISIIIITLFEYTAGFFLIGHKNALLLGILAALGNIIPLFGGIIASSLALLLAFFTNYRLFIRTIILTLILGTIDTFIINPCVYQKTNQIHPLMLLLSTIVGNYLFGPIGLIIGVPFYLILHTIYRKNEETRKVAKLKNN